MPMGRPKPPLLLRLEQSPQHRSLAASRTLPHSLVTSAGIIFRSASGVSNQAIAARLHLHRVTVSYWKRCFLQQDLLGRSGLSKGNRSPAEVRPS